MAFLVVLEAMTPAERVAFLLHDVFGYLFAEVAQITGRTPAACRQLASSARRRIRASQPPETPTARQAAIIRKFKQAWEAKDIGRGVRIGGLRCGIRRRVAVDVAQDDLRECGGEVESLGAVAGLVDGQHHWLARVVAPQAWLGTPAEPPQVIAAIDELLDHHTHTEIAAILNERGLTNNSGSRTGRGATSSALCRAKTRS